MSRSVEPHQHYFSNWQLISRTGTPFGVNTYSFRECACGRREARTTTNGPFGENVQVTDLIDPLKLATIVPRELSDTEMLDHLKKSHYTVEDNVIFSPLQLPEGQIMVDEKLWLRKTREHHWIEMLIGAVVVIAVVTMGFEFCLLHGGH